MQNGKITKISSFPALSSVDEGLFNYLKKINSFPSLTQEEEFLLAKQYIESQNIVAIHQLITSHLKLVAKIAITYKNYGLPLLDIISEGNMGLIHATKKYRPELGFRLSTYAMWWIKAAIQEYILRSWSLVKIGTTAAQKKLFFSLRKIKNKISSIYLREVTATDYSQIAKDLGVEEAEVAEMDKRLSNPDISLDQPIRFDDEDRQTRINLIPETRPSHEISIINQEDMFFKKRLLAQALSTLSNRESYVIKERRLRDPASTLDKLSAILKISKERVRQIENSAFNKICNYISLQAPVGLISN